LLWNVCKLLLDRITMFSFQCHWHPVHRHDTESTWTADSCLVVPTFMEPKVAGIAEGWVTEDSWFDSIQAQETILFAVTVTRPTSYTVGTSGRGVKLTTHLHIVLRSRLPLFQRSSWRGA
jgi:hypothetical protein